MDPPLCNDHLATLLTQDPTVALLLSRISASRSHVLGKPGIICVPCKGSTAEGQQGYYDPNTRRIVLCCDAHRLRKDLRDTLIHELVHAWDLGRDYSHGVYPGTREADEIALEEAGYPRQRGGLKAVFDGVIPKEAEDFARHWYQVASETIKDKLGSNTSSSSAVGPDSSNKETPTVTLEFVPTTTQSHHPFPTTFTSAFLCSEIRASALGQCAPPMLSWFRQRCARKAAVEAAKKHLGLVEPGRAEQEVDRIFDVCFKDPTPVRSK